MAGVDKTVLRIPGHLTTAARILRRTPTSHRLPMPPITSPKGAVECRCRLIYSERGSLHVAKPVEPAEVGWAINGTIEDFYASIGLILKIK